MSSGHVLYNDCHILFGPRNSRFLDKLGLSARLGIDLVVNQGLIGRTGGLFDESFNPHLVRPKHLFVCHSVHLFFCLPFRVFCIFVCLHCLFCLSACVSYVARFILLGISVHFTVCMCNCRCSSFRLSHIFVLFTFLYVCMCPSPVSSFQHKHVMNTHVFRIIIKHILANILLAKLLFHLKAYLIM